MKAAIYARTATNEASTTTQIDLCREYILEKNGDIVGIFDDEGVSAHRLDRDGLDTFIEAADQMKFNTLVVTGFDRLFRNIEILEEFFARMDRLGISVVAVKHMSN